MKHVLHISSPRYCSAWLFMLMLFWCSLSVYADRAEVMKRSNAFDEAAKGQLSQAANHFFKQLDQEEFTDSLISFSQAVEADTLRYNVWFWTAEYLLADQEFSRALGYFERALVLAQAGKNRSSEGDCLNEISICHFRMSHYADAASYAKQASDIFKQLDDLDGVCHTLNTLAAVYLATHQPDEAERYATQAIDYARRLGDESMLAIRYGVMAEICNKQERWEEALSWARKAFEINERQQNEGKMAIRRSQMASALLGMNRLTEARAEFEKAIPVLTEEGNLVSLGISLNQLGRINILQHHDDEALGCFRKAAAIFEQTGDMNNESNARHGLWSVLRTTNPAEAMQHLERYSALRDSVNKTEMQILLANYNALYLNDRLSDENEAVHRTNRRLLWGSIALLLLFAAGAGFFVYAMRLKSRSNRLLRNLQDARERFFTNITHEFRTPLTVIQGMGSDIASDQQLTQFQQERGRALVRQSNHLLELVNQLLDIAKVRSGIGQPVWRHNNVVAYLRMICENHAEQAWQKRIDLIFTPKENHIEMDFVPDYLDKIMGNLISNALKYTAEYGKVYINAVRDGSYLQVEVADNGCGIAADKLPNIFDAFFQANDDQKHIGTGVGLSLVKQMTEAMNGEVRATSTLGKGTSIVVRLPLVAGEGVVVTPTSSAEGSAVPMQDAKSADLQVAEGGGEALRVLVVDDNVDMANYIGSQLCGNYEVFYASDGQQALEKATETVPDLIITDLIMPGIDGLELCRRVRASEAISHIPVIMVTAKGGESARVTGLQAGVDAYLVKPFSSQELNVRVEKLLEQRRLLREKFSQALSQEKADQAELSPADRTFITHLTDVIYSLMSKGTVDVETVAKSMYMSVSQFSRKVFATTGNTPATYIKRVRMSRARQLLDSHPDMPVGEVASRCGFEDNANFTRTFRQIYEVSPTQYRRQLKE